MMKKWMLLLALLLPLAAAGQGVSRKEYVYRADDAYCWEKCKIEVTAPMDGAEHPVIVWFHGGGLTGGHYATPKCGLQRRLPAGAAGERGPDHR